MAAPWRASSSLARSRPIDAAILSDLSTFLWYLFRETAGQLARNAAPTFESSEAMLTTETLEKALSLLELGYTFASITSETGITLEDVEAVHVAWFTGTTEQLFRELQLAGVLELVAAKLRSGRGWDEGTTGDASFCTFIPRT